MDFPKSDATVGLVNGRFVDGSEDPASWANLLTDELLNVLAAAGIAPDEADNGQLLAALKAIIAANANALVKHNFAAAIDPTVNDDATAGYAVNSLWLNASSEEFFICLDASAGAANWQQTTLTLDDLGTVAARDIINLANELRDNAGNDAIYARPDVANNFGATDVAGNLQATTITAGDFEDSTGVTLDNDFEPREAGDDQVQLTGLVIAGRGDLASLYAPLSVGTALGRNTGLQIADGTDLAAIFAKLGSRDVTLDLTVTASADGFDFKTWADGQIGNNYSGYTQVIITVDAGVTLTDATTGVFGIPLKIINNGHMYGSGGHGGKGGTGSPGTGAAGAPGGHGLTMDMDLTLDNTNGELWGGGGGGGGGNSSADGTYGGGGGGGGQGDPEGAGGSNGAGVNGDGQAGTAATSSAPGTGGGGALGAGNGGDGGAWATAGVDSTDGGAGGAAGQAVAKNGHALTLIAQGNTKGTIA